MTTKPAARLRPRLNLAITFLVKRLFLASFLLSATIVNADSFTSCFSSAQKKKLKEPELSTFMSTCLTAEPATSAKTSTSECKARLADIPNEGGHIKNTKLYGILEQCPDTRTTAERLKTATPFPRVVLIPVDVPLEQEEDLQGVLGSGQISAGRYPCWTYKAKIWWSATDSEDVPEFKVCYGDSHSSGPTTVPTDILVAQATAICAKTSDTVQENTTGPKPPFKRTPQSFLRVPSKFGALNIYETMALLGVKEFARTSVQDEACQVWIANAPFTVGAKTNKLDAYGKIGETAKSWSKSFGDFLQKAAEK